MKIRVAEKDDAECIALVHNAAFEEFEDESFVSQRISKQIVSSWFERDDEESLILVAEIESQC